MKPTIAAVLALCIAASASAQAPVSLTGKVYRESAGIASIRKTWERTILFTDANRYVYLKHAEGSTLDSVNHGKVSLITPPADGTYVYTQTSETAGVAVLTRSDGVRETLTMNFTAASGGTTGDLTFYLVDPTTTAPLINVSLRGKVAPGQPLIAGLTLPGARTPVVNLFAPDPSMAQREVLIRAIGPGLANFGLTGYWADPQFQVYTGPAPASLTEVIDGDWATTAGRETAYGKIFAAVGAFPLATGSKDAAAVLRLNPGSYSIVCAAGTADAGGEVLIEVYLLP